MTASQSSTGAGGYAYKALTDQPATSWPGTCTHTNSQYQAWWKVVLSDTWKITEVKLTNRAACCANRLQDVDVFVGTTKCSASVHVLDGETKTIPCVGTGNVIKIQHTGTEYLTLCGFAAKGRKGSAAVASAVVAVVPIGPGIAVHVFLS